LAASAPDSASAQDRPPLNLQDQIPFDPAVQRGTLPNGMQYYIRKNPRPASRVALRLAVKAGSLDEADDQQGLAHFLEHMAFNGSEHFKPGELVSYFESVGARLGPHVNAYTSFEETVYMLELPTDSAEVVSRGFTALADFAGGLTLDPVQVDRERGVVIEEWRGRLGAGSRIQDKQFPVLYHDSRYASRLPIGKPDVLRTAPPARLRAFYDTWYRPELMAIIVVGDIDPAAIESLVRSTFGPIKARAAAAARATAAVPLHKDLLISVAADPEMTASSIQLVAKRPGEPEGRVDDYRRALVAQLFEHMFNDRFAELARKPEAPFLGAGAGGGSLSKDVDIQSLSARVKDGDLARGLTGLAVESRRVRQFGFTDPEVDRAKRWMSAFYEQAYNERDKSESGSFAQEYLRHYLSNEPSPGIEYEYRLVQQVLGGITRAEISALAAERLADSSRVVLAVSPQKAGVTLPTDDDLRKALAEGEAATVTAWTEDAATKPLMENKPAPGTVTARETRADIGVTIVKFSNGLEAWLKPTDFKNDQVLFTMYASGGASIAGRDSFVNATLATALVDLAGVGGFKALDLDRLLAGKLASASPFVSLSTHGISGSAAPAELETALQLLYYSFSTPTEDPEAFPLLKRRLEAAIANRGQSPSQVFGERIAEVNTSNHFSAAPLTQKDIEALDPRRMQSLYRQFFANAADFTLFMVGAFDVEKTIALLAQYGGSLPSTGNAASKFVDLGIQFPTAVQREKVEKGREPRGQTVLSFFADPPPDPVEQERITAASTVLEMSLRDILREELGQTYTVSVGLSQSLPQRGGGHMQVSFGAAPENIDAMLERVVKEIKRLQQEGPNADLTARAQQSARRTYETSLKQNGYWLRRLQTIHLFGGNPSEILDRGARIDSLTPEVLRDTFRKYFPFERQTVVTLVPAAASQQ
jgi:zinc protease